MLTVMIQYLSGEKAGRELILPAVAVEWVPTKCKECEPGLLVRLPPNCGTDAQHVSPTGEKVGYVMNAQGKTISRYDL